MATVGRFDPSGFVTFELSHGAIRTARPAGRAILVPADAVAKLAGIGTSAPIETLGRAIGESIGAQVRANLASSGDPLDAPPEAFLSELNGLLAVHGLGRLALETFGDVLLVRTEGMPLGDAAGRGFAQALTCGILGTFLGREVRGIAVGDAGGPAIVVAGAGAIDRAAEWAREGATPESIASQLHREYRGAREGA